MGETAPTAAATTSTTHSAEVVDLHGRLETSQKEKPEYHALFITGNKEETVIRCGYHRSNRVDRFHLHHWRRTGGDTETAQELSTAAGQYTGEEVRVVGGPAEGS
ncbi:hypothetical protein [Streptomyces sp. SID2888]|uniref:hypothetical protein n=1 Tax=Streptomyces sp. SID2888 TaxID=2690256 RepID=UPI001F2061A5|nr:hypothetical protein [Streptomyces sp. SID2888]